MQRPVPWRWIILGVAGLLLLCICVALFAIVALMPTRSSILTDPTRVLPTLDPDAAATLTVERSMSPTPAAAAETPTTAPGQPTPTPAEPAFASGGLGLSQNQWEAVHGAGVDSAGMHAYEDQRYVLTYHTRNINHLEVSLPDSYTIDDARAVAITFTPTDSTLVKTYTSDTGQIVDLYHSDTLADRFPATVTIGTSEVSSWLNAEPGDFIVIYRPSPDGGVSGLVFGLGNNP
jgi:hypothetical protein